MTEHRDHKRLLNEVLPDSKRATEREGGTPRARTAEHLRRIMAAGLVLQLSGDLAGCGSADPPKPPEPAVQQPQPPRVSSGREGEASPSPGSVGYGVVDALPPPTPPRALGFLHLESTPIANIIVDGRRTGLATPQTRLRLTAGSHEIRLEAEDGGLVDRFTVEIVGGALQSVTRNMRADRNDPPKD